MNPWQLTQTLVSLLSPANLAWPDSPAEPILGRVGVWPGVGGDFFAMDAVVPFALVHPETTRSNEEHPADLVDEARWSIFLFAGNASEQAGGPALVGGSRASLGSSKGRGILEVEGRVKIALFDELGLVARLRSGGTQPPDVAGRQAGFGAQRALEIVATHLPALPAYAPIQQLLASSPSAGHVTLTWAALSSTRYDLVGVTVVYKSGATAPTSPTDGTAAFTAGAPTSATVATGTGMFSFAVFWAYDATVDPFSGIGTTPVAANRWSSSETAQNGTLYLPATATSVVVA